MSRIDIWILTLSGAITGGLVTHYLPPPGGWAGWLAHFACMGIGCGIYAAFAGRKEKP